MGDYIVNRIFNSITYILPTGNEKDCWLVDCGDVEDFVLAHPENVRVIEDECTIDLCGMQVAVFFVPSHEPSCLAFRIGDALYTGDAYIPGVKVVTSFPRSNKQQAAESFARLQQLEESGLMVRPGHII